MGLEYISANCKKKTNEIGLYIDAQLQPHLLFADDQGRYVIMQTELQRIKSIKVGLYTPTPRKN